jgi:hypothetical protein
MSPPTIDELVLADDPGSWSRLGFRLDGSVCELGRVRVRFTGAGPGAAIASWSLREPVSTELDGLPTIRSAAAIREPAQAQPNGVLRIDHIVAMSPAFERSLAAIQAAGLDLRRVREEPTPAGAPRQAFFRLGEEILELVQEPDEAVARGGGPDRPARFWGLAVLTDDIDRTASAFGAHVGTIRDAVQRGRRIATVARSAGLRLPLALISVASPREPVA